MYLLDTNILSEARRRSPNAGVAAWLEQVAESDLYLSVLVLGEIHKGIAKLPTGEPRTRLQSWLEHDLTPRFEGRVLNLDMTIAVRWGVLFGEAEARGTPLPIIDTLLAATALQYDLILVTRNTQDFRHYDLKLLDPWNPE